MADGPKFEFYVLNYDFNRKKVYNYNIFNNIHVYDWTLKAVKKHLRNKKLFPFVDLVKEIDSIIHWQEWSRTEYEISVGDAFETDINKFEKWDCYGQAKPNMEVITQMCIDRYKKWKKESKIASTYFDGN